MPADVEAASRRSTGIEGHAIRLLGRFVRHVIDRFGTPWAVNGGIKPRPGTLRFLPLMGERKTAYQSTVSSEPPKAAGKPL